MCDRESDCFCIIFRPPWEHWLSSRFTYDLPMRCFFTLHASVFFPNEGLVVLMLQYGDICSDLVNMRVGFFHAVPLSGLMFCYFHTRRPWVISLCIVFTPQPKWAEKKAENQGWFCQARGGRLYLCCWHNSDSFYPMSARSMWTSSVLNDTRLFLKGSDIRTTESRVSRMRNILCQLICGQWAGLGYNV